MTGFVVTRKTPVNLSVESSESEGFVRIGVNGESVRFDLTRTMARAVACALDDDVDVSFTWRVGEGASPRTTIVKVTSVRGRPRYHELLLMSEHVTECHLELDGYDTDVLRDVLLTFLGEEGTDGRPAVVTVDKEVSE